ncbi:MAG: hypothetical protein GY805_30395, partial [Chloroflexi bacterium]|nr:hypothetical protein [Chloroflexota bacterium]
RGAIACLNEVNIQGNNADANGGGILNVNSDLCLENSAVISNTAAGIGSGNGYGGGINNDGYLVISNTTVSQNAAILGGGIFNEGRVAELTHTTIVSNTASQRGGGVLNASGAELYVQNTIILGNVAHAITMPEPDCRVVDDKFFGGGVNLVGSGTGCSLSGGTTLTSTTPGNEVESLGYNGGETLTHALTSTSQAIDAGDSAFCPNADQRGETRDDLACDIGAYEMKLGALPFYIFLPVILE